MGFTVITPGEQRFEPQSWKPDEPERRLVELRRLAELSYSQAGLWRYPPGASGRRHREPLQEEVFCVVDGTLTMLLGDPAELYQLPPRSLVVVEPRTAVQIRNDSDADVVFFAYGAPQQPANNKADILEGG